MTTIVLSWKEWLEDLKIERAPDGFNVVSYVDAMPVDRTAFVLDTMSPAFTDKLAQYGSKSLVELYNALASRENSPPVNKFQDKDTGLRRIGLKLIELAKSAPVLSSTAQPKEEKKVPDDSNRGRKRRYADDQVITVLADKNPKREGSAAHDRFAKYRSGMTVAQAVAAGVTRGDLTFDADHSFIKIEAPTAAAA